MELFIDVGNSRLKWAQREKDYLSSSRAVPYQPHNLVTILKEQWGDLQPPTKVYISNVGQKCLNDLFIQWCKQRWHLCPIFATTTKKSRFILNGYDDPLTLGIDRWLALLGAQPYLSTNGCVVDCGTATTIDILQVNGLHLGGFILAGLQTSRMVLFDKAAALKNVQLNQQVNHLQIGKNTHDGIALGTIYAIAGGIEKIAAAYCAKVIVTGGDAIFILPHLKCDFLYLPDLVLQGLTRWADEQQL